jgi:potassium channel subfamily K
MFYWKYSRFSFIESVYFVTVSVTTVGYGDVVPHDNFSRMFTVFYIGLGMVLIVGIIYRAIMDVLNSYQARITEVGKGVIEVTNPKKRRRKIIALYALHILYAGLLIGTPIFLGMFVMYYTAPPEQDMDFISSFYWAAQTCATIGYGDIIPIGDWNKLWVCAYILFGVTCVSAAIAQIGTLHLTIRAYKRMEVLQNKQLSLSLIAQLDAKGHGVDKFEFLAAMLLVLEKVEPSEISEILSQFDELDQHNTGVVSTHDIVVLKRNGQLPTLMTMRGTQRDLL